IAAQYLRLRQGCQALPLIWIAQDKFPRPERHFPWIARRHSCPLDGWLADAILEAKVLASGGQGSTILARKHRQAWHRAQRPVRSLQHCLAAWLIRREYG